MNKSNKITSQSTQKDKLDISSQQTSNQWQVHNNRLNYLQQTMTRIQKKIQKIQKSLVSVSQASSEFKIEFSQKISEMISIVSQPQSNLQGQSVSVEKFDEIKREIRSIRGNLDETLATSDHMQRDMNHLVQTNNCNLSELREFVNDKMSLLEHKNRKFMNQKLGDINRTIEVLQKNIQAQKNQSSQLQDRILQRASSFLNTSSLQRASSLSALSHSQSQSKFASSNSRSSNVFQIAQPVRQHAVIGLSKRLNFTNDQQQFVDKKGCRQVSSSNSTSGVNVAKNNSESTTCTNHQSVTPMGQNNSRVVYLRQKLKQFQQINKKYQNKQVQYERKKKQVTSQRNKPTQNNCGHQDNNRDVQSEQSNNYEGLHMKKCQKWQSQTVLARSRQTSASKRYVNSSIKSKIFTQQTSAKKVDKLKSIKDYLQQTQSQIQDSFLQPNYNNRYH